MKKTLLVGAALALCLTASCGGNKIKNNKDAVQDNAASPTRAGNSDPITNIGGAQGDGQSATTMGTGAAGTDSLGLFSTSGSATSNDGTPRPTDLPNNTSGHHRRRSSK